MNLRKLHNKSHYVHKYNFFNHFTYFNRSRWPERHIVSLRSCLTKWVDAKTRTYVSDWAHFRVIYQIFSNRYAIYLQYIGMSIWIDSRNASVQNFIFIMCLYWMTFNEVFRILSKTPSNIFQRKNWGWKCCQQAKKKFHWSSKMTTLEHHEFCLCVFILAISRELKRRNSWKYSKWAR